ncbi:MAG: DUF1501 domain-containing protein [Chthoniobacter sp.]|nr:DUF1501 domain-containing protein [Chthoniobacter sp.]
MRIDRRFFLHRGALALAGTAALPAFLVRALQAEAAPVPRRRLVVIFQRGAADGLNIVVPHTEKNYYALRPGIAIPEKQVLDLDGFFGLHPSLASFKPLYSAGHLAIVHAAGSPDSTRSHFDAQDYMESGTPGVKNTPDGWLNRALTAQEKIQDKAADAVRSRQPQTAFRAVALGTDLPRTLAGRIPAIALGNLGNFSVGGHTPAASIASDALESMYANSTDRILHTAGDETFDAIKMLRDANPAQYKPAAGVNYPASEFGNSMRQIAQLLKSNLGVEVAFTDVNGWDTHQNQGGATGQLANRLTDFAQAISAFWRDMGDDAENLTLVTMSEFGRTAKENGTGGTDHGHANAMFVLGGRVKGGKVYGQWPGLADDQLNEGRDLKLTTDYRQVLSEVLTHSMGSLNRSAVFPGAEASALRPLGLI